MSLLSTVNSFFKQKMKKKKKETIQFISRSTNSLSFSSYTEFYSETFSALTYPPYMFWKAKIKTLQFIFKTSKT